MFNFHVPDNIWASVVPKEFRDKVVCLRCFDKFAFENKINHAKYLDKMYFVGDKAIMELKIVWAKDI